MKSVSFNDSGRMIKIEGHILDRIFQYRQTRIFQRESGGVIIGRELKSTGNLIIEEVTEPMRLDKQSRFGFERKDPTHMDCFHKLYELSRATYGYFGEWHTHPEKMPHYSVIDKRNWIKLYKELPQKHALYFMICGTISIGVWKIDLLESDQPIYLFGTEWDDLRLEEHRCEE